MTSAARSLERYMTFDTCSLLMTLKDAGGGRINATVGSALDIYGGELPYAEVVNICKT